MPTFPFVPRTISLSFPGAVMVIYVIYVIVELDITRECEEDLMAANGHTQGELWKKTSDYLRYYCSSYFDMNIGIKEFRRRVDYSYP